MTLLTTGANADMIVASVLTLIIFALVGMAVVKRDASYSITAAPLAMLTVGLMISVSIVKAGRK